MNFSFGSKVKDLQRRLQVFMDDTFIRMSSATTMRSRQIAADRN
jgi:hypothetical protein